MRQCSKSNGPLTESIMEKEEEKKAEEGREEEKEEREGCHYGLVTQTCVVAIGGTQPYRNPVSKDAWRNCREKDQEFSASGIKALIQGRHLSARGQGTVFVCCQRRLSQQVFVLNARL